MILNKKSVFKCNKDDYFFFLERLVLDFFRFERLRFFFLKRLELALRRLERLFFFFLNLYDEIFYVFQLYDQH